MPTVQDNLQRLAVFGVYAAAREGMAVAVEDLLADATLGLPSTPMDTGALRASGTAFVDRNLVAVNPQEVGLSHHKLLPGEESIPPQPAMTHSEALDKNAVNGLVVFNQEYAEEVHDGGPRNWTTAGSGDKFLEDKIPDAAQGMLNQLGKSLSAYIGA